MDLNAPVLPDSRPRVVRGARIGIGGVYWVPIFCYNCGAAGGQVPEENMTFVSWLCNKCAPTYGLQANEMLLPDEVFWQKVKEEQMGAYGRLLTTDELVTIVEEDASALATLLKEGRSL